MKPKAEEKFKDLEKKIKQKFHSKNSNGWVWPRASDYSDKFKGKTKRVRGFFGTSNIIIITEKPARPYNKERLEKFPTKRDVFLYNVLGELGLENAHLTDLVKESDIVGKIKPEQVFNSKEFLIKEIEILRSCNRRKLKFIALSKDVDSYLKACFGEASRYVEYFYRFSKLKKHERERKFKKELELILKS